MYLCSLSVLCLVSLLCFVSLLSVSVVSLSFSLLRAGWQIASACETDGEPSSHKLAPEATGLAAIASLLTFHPTCAVNSLSGYYELHSSLPHFSQAILAARTALDAALYSLIQERFLVKIADYGPSFVEEVADFKKLNAAYLKQLEETDSFRTWL
eukprot:m.313518 g.313518  ORF g.313518 m.313518 type:complete len:155 (-) comp55409_c0_seq8:53-517(-)